MAYNGSGTFLINTAGQPVVPNTVISATAFNALTNDLANGLSTCITKDGQTTPTANIPMGNNKITGLAPGTSGTDAANLSQVQGSTAKLLQSVTGTDTITAAMVPALTSYSAGQMFYFVAAGDNTGAVTINIDSLGAKSVTRDGSTALVAGDIVSGEVALIVYDGTRFQLLNGNSFTNLNVSNNLTLSGGTANGVLYLNGSKVATSGSALTFDGTIFRSTQLNIGTAPNANSRPWALNGFGYISGASGNGIEMFNSSTSTYGYWTFESDNRFSFNAFGGHSWTVGGSEGMRLTSTGLGIGTASPGSLWSGANKLVVGSGSAAAGLTIYTSTSTAGTLAFGDGTTGSDPYVGYVQYNHTDNTMSLGTSGTTKATLDSSGNLGLGVTPSVWGSGRSAIDMGANAYIGGTSLAHLTNNVFFNGTNFIYKTTAAAGMYQIGSAHAWFTAPSGTAGNAITFTQAMTLTSGALLQVAYPGNTSFYAQLDASDGNGHVRAPVSNMNLVFDVSGSERGRFTAGGYFKASNDGTYQGSTSSYHELRSDANSQTVFITNTNSAYTTNLIQAESSTAAGSGFNLIRLFSNGVAQFQVRGDGVVFAQNTTIQSISDSRLKENVRDALEGLNVINLLRPVRYDWKEGFGNNRKDQLGFIAQEVEAVFPDAVSDWAAKEDEEAYKTVGPAALIPVLVKAIQELSAKVSALEAK